MVNANLNQQANPSQPIEPIMNQPNNPTPPAPQKNTNKKSILAVLGLALFFVLSMAGVLIALRQRQVADQTVAPTAPESRPAAAIDPALKTCTLSFDVPAATYGCNTLCETDAQCQTANAGYVCSSFKEESHTLGEGTVMVSRCRLETNLTSQTCQAATVIECNSECTTDAQCQSANLDYICHFDDETTQTGGGIPPVASGSGDIITGSCRLKNNVSSETCKEAGVIECNSECTTDAQCQTADPDYICAEVIEAPGEAGTPSAYLAKACRLKNNVASETCKEAEEITYECNSSCETNAQCQTADEDYLCYQNNCRLDENLSSKTCDPKEQEEAYVSCNEACTANADCKNAAHICYNGACRLGENPSSQTCSYEETKVITKVITEKGQTIVYTKGGEKIVMVPSDDPQPVIPAELPKSGSEDVLNWLKAGLGVLGMGAVLLLLL